MKACSTDHTRTGVHLRNSRWSLTHQPIGPLLGSLLSYGAGWGHFPVTLSFKPGLVLFQSPLRRGGVAVRLSRWSPQSPPSQFKVLLRGAGVHLGILVVLWKQNPHARFSTVSLLWEMDPWPDPALPLSFVSLQIPPLVFPASCCSHP